jgi:hypothetical protein
MVACIISWSFVTIVLSIVFFLTYHHTTDAECDLL